MLDAMSERTQVAIVGAGPAGLLLGRLLERAGIEAVVLEARDRAHVEGRLRAGVLEQGTVDLVRQAGVGSNMDAHGLVHHGVELRFGGRGHRIDFDRHAPGRSVVVYGQQELVRDLIAARVQSGAPLTFEAQDVALHDLDTALPRVSYRVGDEQRELQADVVMGCDGFHGPSRAALPAALRTTSEREYPFAWLGILADVAPSCDELIYADHPNGFAMHSLRSREVSRLYLQVAPDEDLAAWSDDRIWDELQTRLATHDGYELREGPIREKGITPMRSFVSEPMRHGRLLLAGDAAHIVPPTGAKGLNLAVADVRVALDAIVELLERGSEAGLDAYSATCLRRIWRVQHFSWWMTTMLHTPPGEQPFDARLRRSQLDYVCGSDAAAATLAENYVGLTDEQLAGAGATGAPLPVSLPA